MFFRVLELLITNLTLVIQNSKLWIPYVGVIKKIHVFNVLGVPGNESDLSFSKCCGNLKKILEKRIL